MFISPLVERIRSLHMNSKYFSSRKIHSLLSTIFCRYTEFPWGSSRVVLYNVPYYQNSVLLIILFHTVIAYPGYLSWLIIILILFIISYHNTCPYCRLYLIGGRFPVTIVIIITIIIIIIIIITIITIAIIIIIIIIIIVVVVIVIVILEPDPGTLPYQRWRSNSRCLSCGTISGSTSDYSFIVVTITVIALYL